MKHTFQHQLNMELLLSERRRTLILILIFTLVIIYRLLDIYFFHYEEASQRGLSVQVIWLFPFTILLFEISCLLYIIRRIRKNAKKISLGMQYINTAIEICLPSVILSLFAKQFPTYNVLQSPAVFIYFVFIILSTLRLNFLLSTFCGILASGSYVFLALHLYQSFDSSDGTRAFIILFCGFAAGLVARQIRAGIDRSLKEADKRHRIENIFGQQLSSEIAEKMIENDGMLESKRMDVAIMFIDIRNFSGYAANKNPEEIVRYQNDFFSIVINAVGQFNGVVHQFLGDGCMVTFGAPVSLSNPSRNAVSAAKFLLSELERANANGQLIKTKIGIGIHSGEVITGNIGTAVRQQYSITGTVVILASRIEQLNKQYGSQLLVSETVFNQIGPVSASTCYTQVALKGWHKPVGVYRLA